MLHGNGTGHGNGKNDVLSEHKMTKACRPPVIHVARFNDKFHPSSQLLDDGWWMGDKSMMTARQSMS